MSPGKQMPITRPAIIARLVAVFMALWAVAALFELGHPQSMAIAPVAPICFGLSSLWRGDIEVAIVSLAVSLFAVAMTVFSIAKRRALWAAITAVVLYWFWSLALQGISA